MDIQNAWGTMNACITLSGQTPKFKEGSTSHLSLATRSRRLAWQSETASCMRGMHLPRREHLVPGLVQVALRELQSTRVGLDQSAWIAGTSDF